MSGVNSQEIPRYGVYEGSFTDSGEYANPYLDLEAVAVEEAPATIFLGAGAMGEYGLRLFNLQTGEIESLGSKKLEDRFEWTPPDAGDWVLHLMRW